MRQAAAALTGIGTLVVALCAAPASRAEAGEWAWSVGGSVLSWQAEEQGALERRTAPGVALAVRVSPDDFWDLAMGIDGGAGFGGEDGPVAVGRFYAEARYVLDALTWVPWVCAGAGGLIHGDFGSAGSSEDEISAAITVHLGVGIAYRPRREWSLDLAYRKHTMATDIEGMAGPTEVAVTWSQYLE